MIKNCNEIGYKDISFINIDNRSDSEHSFDLGERFV